MNTNFEQWKKLTRQQQKETAAMWNIKKDEGQEIAAAVLKAFIEKYGSNKSFQITDEIVRGNGRWVIFVQCLDDSFLPKNFMGITVGCYHIDHIDDGVSFEDLTLELWGWSPAVRRFQQPYDSKCVGFLASYGRHTLAVLDFYTPHQNTNPLPKRFSL